MRDAVLPDDFGKVVTDVKLAILEARARAAQASNADFFLV